jgi:hypothetical protein
LTQNPIDLDYAGRLHAFEYFADRTSLKLIHIASMGMVAAIPILVLFDFAAAFPSVAHAWMFLVLRGIKLWGGYITGIEGLYTGNKAYGCSGGFVVFLFWILAGVLQGCPMSGTLFVFAIDPLLWSFKLKISSAVVRTCADDIGMALKRLDTLALLYKLFHDFKSASNLTLKPAKTIIIHTVTKHSNWNNDWIHRWLRRYIPQWQYMIIKDSSKYLGFHLGPRAGANQWNGAISKFAERVIDLKDLDLPLRLAVNRYNYKILPVLGYIGQLALPPPRMCRFELSAILKALKFAGNSMTCETAYTLEGLLGFTPTRPSVYLESCMLRSSLKTFVGFVDMHKKLLSVSESSNCLAQAFHDLSIIPPGWDSPAFCSNLFHAQKFERLQHASKCKSELHEAIKKWTRKPSGEDRPACNFSGPSLQKIFYNTLHRTISKNAQWTNFISGKLDTLAPTGAQAITFTSDMWSQLCSDLRKTPSPTQTCFLKTVINSWATSHRYGEVPLLPCILGCEKKEDNLKHYLECDPLWTLAVSACGLPLNFISLLPLERLCIVNRSPASLRLLSVVFRAYHALRLGHSRLIDHGITHKVFDNILLKYHAICVEIVRQQ